MPTTSADDGHTVSPHVVAYLNRLGDLVHVLARRAAGHGPPATVDV